MPRLGFRQNSSDMLRAARRRFFDDGTAPRGLVPDTILRSWQRCAGLGLSASTRPHVEPLTQSALRIEREKHESLAHLCLPEMQSLYADARATGSIVILAAPDGMILQALGSADFLGKAARVALQPGVPWSEQATGTNAIGTAMIEGRALEVRGAEHFFAPHRVLSCSAVPIIDPFGNIAGVLDLSGESSVHHTHALGMVRLAVEEIERRLFTRSLERDFKQCRVLRVKGDAADASEGLLVFDNERLTGANRIGLHALGLERGDIGRRRFEDVFNGASMAELHNDIRLRDARGHSVHIQIDAESQAQTRIIHVPATRSGVRKVTYPVANAPIFDATIERELDRAQRVLGAGMSVLLLGETGSGKEVFARELHRRIDARAPFVAVNCAGLPETLIESELFGYEEGAFTGARRRGATGLLREANGGVLFLDEIGDMPPALQPRLLRVLQEREVTPLGGKPVKVDFAVIAATHRSLDANGNNDFRSDLYFRIANYCVNLPNLRDSNRAGLIQQLFERLSAGSGVRLDAEVFDLLTRYEWPGNLRELHGTLRTMIALAGDDGIIRVDDLPIAIRNFSAAAAITSPLESLTSASLDAVTDRALREALEIHLGNVSAAARSLNISRSTFYRRLQH